MINIISRAALSCLKSCTVRNSVNSLVKGRLPSQSFRQFHHSIDSLQPKILQTSCNLPNYSQIRWKKKKQGTRTAEEVESDDETEQDLEVEPGTKVTNVVVASLRVDLVLKACFGLARNKVEVLFYEGKIRVNEEKLKKKSESVKIGDVVDVILGPSPENPENFILVNRVEILGAHEKNVEKLTLHVNKQTKLLVQNKK